MKLSNFFLAAVFGVFMKSAAQQNFTLYPMSSIPQSNMLNPSRIPDSKWHIGIPALNSTYLQYSNSGFSLNKIFGALELKNPDTSILNLNRVLDILSKKNFIAFRFEQSWLQGGFRFQNHYFHFSAIEKANIRVSLPKDLFRFVIDGNGGPNLGETFSFGPKADAIHYREYALGYSYQLPKNLRIGGRIKLLKGYNILEVKKSTLDITTSSEDFSYLMKANIKINAASTYADFLNSDSTTPDFKPSNLMKSSNRGFGLDLGASWNFSDKLQFSASIIDLGFIHWNQNVANIVSSNPNASFNFNGIHVKSSDTNDFNQYFEQLGDTLSKVFNLENTHQKFNSALSTEFFIGANYSITKRLNTGALFYGDFYNKRFYPGLTLNCQYRLGRAFSFNVTNTLYNRSWLNLGLGASVNIGPWQMYSVMDNVLFPFAISSLKTFSWRFGTNLTFGRERSKPKKVKGDKGGEGIQTDPGTL